MTSPSPEQAHGVTADAPGSGWHPSKRLILISLATVVVLILCALGLQDLGGGDGFGLVKAHQGSSYVLVGLLVFLDAVIPIFPGETTVSAASTLAATGSLNLELVMVSAALGAVIGDSALYWTARLFSRRLSEQIDHIKSNEKVSSALRLLGDNAPLLLTTGRFVPGVRFVVNATLGTAHFPYRRFLLWSAVGGILWSVYTSLLAYAVGTTLDNFPLASTIVSGFITTAIVGVVLWIVRRQRIAARRQTAHDLPSPGPGDDVSPG
jgi:membrane-associated protein